MTKLDEIEASIHIVQTFVSGIPAQKYTEDMRLLIRAVRQLGAVANAVLEARTDDDGYVFDTLGEPAIDKAYGTIDSDILELIENPISVVANDGAESKDR